MGAPTVSLILMVLSLSFLSGRVVRAEPENGEKVYQRTLRGTVWILARHGERMASGTGSLIDKTHRLVITNAHVVGEAQRVSVIFPAFPNGKLNVERRYYWQLLSSGKAIGGRVIDRDTKRDLALVQLDSVPVSAQHIPRAAEGVSPGQRVHSVGNPGRSGALWVYTSGTVRTQAYLKAWRVYDGEKFTNIEARVIETQSPTNQGDSGGPLVNDRGELVAVTQGYATDAQLLSLFIDISEVQAFLKKSNWLGQLPPPRRGGADDLTATTANDKASEGGTIVPAVDKATEQRAATNLEFAKTLAEAGKTDSARKRYEKIIADFPNTKAAGEAKLLLDKLEK
jgi:S1-C subfamily serine protease